MATPTRRSTRVSKGPDRLAPVAAHPPPPPPSMTPRKRSKETGLAAKEAASAFAMPLSASSKRQKTSTTKQKPRSRATTTASDDDEDDSDAGSEENREEEEASESAGRSSSEDEEETSDFEEIQPKAAPKTPQRRGQRKTKQGAARTASRAKASSGGAPSGVVGSEASQLLSAIIDEDVALAQVVMDWIGSYRETADPAICELINLFVKLTGCPGSISEDALYETEAIEAVLEALQKQSLSALKQGGAEIDGGDDLLLGKSKEHRKFRKNALLFVQKLVIDGQHHLIFDEINESNGLSAFTEAVLQWLANMAGSSYRPFRHVATLVALTIQSALVSIRAHISTELQTTHRQLDAELKRATAGSRRKPAAGKESARAEQLRARVATLSEQDEMADTAFMVFYNTVFIYRYRDVNPMIRSECLFPLAGWCRAYPASYLNTEYLRYLGWSLNDKDPRVREAAITAVTGPLLLGKTSHSQGNVGGGVGVFGGVDSISDESFSEGIRPFIMRFLARLVQIAAGDIDSKVQVAAIKLVTQLGKHGYLDPSAKIGDIRNLKRGSKSSDDAGRSGKKAKGGRRGGKRNARSHEKYSHSLSQQLLEESSSESEGESDSSGNEDSSGNSASAGALDIHVLYDNDDDAAGTDRRFSSAQDGSKPLSCPRHSTMRYLAPLVAHTHASVRLAASDLVAWWIKGEWMVSAQVAALGVDAALEGGVLDRDDESQSTNDDVEMSGDSDITVSELLSSPARKQRARKWLLFKSLGAFLWHLQVRTPARGKGSDDDEGRRQWAMEQAASCVEELWATPASAVGLSAGEEQNLALAGSTVRGIAPTALDSEIEAAMGSDQCAIPPRAVAAAQALWHKIPELCDLSTLSAFLAWDHSAIQSPSASSSHTTALSSFALSQCEETALLQAYAVWVLENSRALADKKRRLRNKKDKSELDEDQQAMSRVWQSMYVPLLVRNIGNPQRLLPLVYLAAEAMDLQVLFDADRVDMLGDVARNIMLVLERHGDDVRLCRLATSFLERVDASGMLAQSMAISEQHGLQGDVAGTVPGDLVCKAARTASSLLVTAIASVPETSNARSTAAYADVYARVVALRSMIRSKDISVLLAASPEESAALDMAEESAALNERSRDAPIEQLYVLLELAAKSIGMHTVPEKTAIAVLDVAYYFLLWRALKLDALVKQHAAHPFIASSEEDEGTERSPFWRRVESAADNLKRDRDRLVGLCMDLADESALNYLRLRELAFAVLGRISRLFTGAISHEAAVDSTAGSQRAREIRRTLSMQSSGAQIRTRLSKFFEHRVAHWASLVDALSQQQHDRDQNNGALDGNIGWYVEAPTSWSIAYARFCTLAALWAQWIGDQTVPMRSLVSIAAYTGMLGLERLEKYRIEASRPEESGVEARATKRKIGFVSLSAFDHIVQAAVDGLKPMIVLQGTRDMAMDMYMEAMRASLEKNITAGQVATGVVADPVNTGTLARFIGTALRSAFAQGGIAAATPARGRRGADGTAFALAPAVVGAAWTQHHLKAIDYGVSRVTKASGDEEEGWETLAAPWFAALAQTVGGVLRPRHAEVVAKRVAEIGSSDAETAIAPYQRALDKELAKLEAINARMAEVRAADSGRRQNLLRTGDILSSPPVSPSPVSRMRKQLSMMGVAEQDDMDVDE
ncbi:cohesin complex subunit [Coemansia sp. RSA 1933]|nr:cohesin complex subunit [Coemansia sp. RSA 1933]